MRPAPPYFALLLLLALYSSCKHPIFKSDRTDIVFVSDSGFISDTELFKKIKFDTVNSKDSLYKMINIPNDTVGKYYKGSNGHYFSCLSASQGYMSCLLVETLADGSIINQSIFGVGVHDCCWSGSFDGFRKYGDYISFRTCTTGTVVCGGSISLFKTLDPKADLGYINESLWYAGVNDTVHDLTSTMVIENDTVYMHYKEELYTEQNDKRNVINNVKFTIRYVSHEDKWIALDSSKVSLGL